MSRVQLLRTLQAIDQEWDGKGRRFQDVRKLLTDTTELARLRADLQSTQSELTATRTALRDSELELASLQTKRQEVQASLYSGHIHNPKDLEMLQKESEILSERASHLEDEILNLMTSADDLDEAAQTSSAVLSAFEAQAKTAQAQLTQEYSDLRLRLTALKEQREKVRGTLPGTDLALYDDLRVKKNGAVMAAMVNSSCQACRVSVPSNKASLAGSGDEVVLCEGCGRILFLA